MLPCAVTVLTNVDAPLCLQNKARAFIDGAWVKVPRPFGRLFTSKEYSITSLADLALVLDTIATRPQHVVIRGRCTVDGTAPHQRLCTRGRPAAENTYEPAPRRWVMFDFDETNYPAPEFKTNPQATVEAFKATLPSPWREASCYWQASGSAGFSDALKLHLWFWLDRAIGQQELRALFPLEHIGPHKLDARVFTSVQLHYTARPTITGAPDPMGARSGMIHGETDTVTLPEISNVVQFSPAAIKKAKAQLKDACADLTATQDGERTNKLFSYACRFGRQSCLDDAFIFTALHDAAISAGYDAAKGQEQITNGLRLGRAERQERAATPWRKGLITLEDETGSDKILPAMHNYIQILSLHPAFTGVLSYQDRRKEVDVLDDLPWRSDKGVWREADDSALRAWFEKELSIFPRKGDICDAVLAVAHAHARDPFKEWLKGLEWDGTQRLKSMYRLFEVAPSTYAEHTFAWWLISAVARTMRPGSQVDHMLVLQGAQGFYKSSALAALVPEPPYYTTFGGQDLSNKDSKAHLHGPVLVCIDEMAALKGRNAETIKHFITERTDRFRPSYGMYTKDFPRSNVFCGTTNSDTFLEDVTGGRRFWPHLVAKPIDVARIAGIRDQLWAEALHEFNLGARWYPTPQESQDQGMPAHQEAVRSASAAEELLEAALATRPTFGTWEPGQLDEQGRVQWLKLGQIQDLCPTLNVTKDRTIRDALKALGWRQARTKTYRYWQRGE